MSSNYILILVSEGEWYNGHMVLLPQHLTPEAIKARTAKATATRNARLTIKQRKFTAEVVKSGDATKAAQKVYGYKKSTAKQEAARIMKLPKVKLKIEELLKNVGYDAHDSLSALIKVQDMKPATVKGSEVIAAAKLLLELSGNYTPKTYQAQVKYNIDMLDSHNLETVEERYNRLITERNAPNK